MLVSPLVEAATGSFKFSKTDYTKADSWFEDDSGKKRFVSDAISFFTLTIPKLRIERYVHY